MTLAENDISEGSGQWTGFPAAMPAGIVYGGDYNPEQWPEEIWRQDAELMAEAGVNMVCVGIFAWGRLEPQPGVYDLDWLGRVIDLLWAKGIAVCLATATASPPVWFSRRFPQSLPVTREGLRIDVGSRQHYCPNSADYREAGARLIRQLAGRFGSHPAVALWHVNNEIGCHSNRCHCGKCAAEFVRWLEQRYASVAELNRAWGTAFWSQQYGDWSEVRPPGLMTTIGNPCQELDYQRFMSDSLRDVLVHEIGAIRELLPDARVTTNGVSWFKPADYWEWFRHCDIAALDCYPDPQDPLAASHEAALCHDLYRSFKGGRPFILMEQVTTQVNWRPVNVLKKPGQMRALSLGAVARGGDGVMFFQWRASRAGAEKFHGAMLPHFGPGGRVFREVKELGRDLQALRAVCGARTTAKVAVILGWENRWALELDSKPVALDYERIVRSWHRPLRECHIATDIVPPGAPLDGYEVVVAPALYQLSAAQAADLAAFVRRGGTLVMTYFSAITDECDRIWPDGQPAMLREVFGMAVEEWQPLPAGHSNGLLPAAGGDAVDCHEFCEIVHCEGGEALATFTQDFFAGMPAIVKHRHGEGSAYYFATQPDADFLRDFLGKLLAERGIAAPVAADPAIDVALRTTAEQEFLFVINQGDSPGQVRYGEWSGAADLLDGSRVAESESLPGFAARVLARPR